MEEKNLVVLMYAGNNQTDEFNTKVVDFAGLNSLKWEGQSVVVDLEKKVWNYQLYSTEWNNVPIGQSRSLIPRKAVIHQEYKQGVIGVYDRTNTKHLDAMASAAIEATKYKNPSLVNDD
ncbi:MAG: hypothetical protein NTY99_03150 [DPANN group archaeon]|nr:hypothetical protein [DPANN group archaeon]